MSLIAAHMFYSGELSNLDSIGWGFSATVGTNWTEVTSVTKTYDGDAVASRVGLRWDNNNRDITIPSRFTSSPEGRICIAVGKETGTLLNGAEQLLQADVDGNRRMGIDTNSDGTLDLILDQTNQGTTDPYDWDELVHVVFSYDVATSPVAGTIYINGVSALSGTENASSLVSVGRWSTSLGQDAVLAQIRSYDTNTDTEALEPRVVSRYEYDTDGTDVGTWTPTAGTNHDSVDSPYDTQESANTSPSVGDRLVLESSSDIATQLGISPDTIDAVITESLSYGDTLDATMYTTSGASEDGGASKAIATLDGTHHQVVTTQDPDTASAWLGTATPGAIYEVD